MTHQSDKNLGKLSLERGGLYGTRFTAAERCKAKVREQVYRLRAERGVTARALDCVAEGVTNPTGEPVKLIYRMKAARFTWSDVYRTVIVPQIEELNAAFGREYDPAA